MTFKYEQKIRNEKETDFCDIYPIGLDSFFYVNSITVNYDKLGNEVTEDKVSSFYDSKIFYEVSLVVSKKKVWTKRLPYATYRLFPMPNSCSTIYYLIWDNDNREIKSMNLNGKTNLIFQLTDGYTHQDVVELNRNIWITEFNFSFW